jgi:L-fuconolactonase
MVDTPIIDTHVHFWDTAQFPRPWLDTIPALHRTLGLSDYQEQTIGLPIVGMLYVETDVAPGYALREAEWAVSLAQTTHLLQGVVAAAPLEEGLRGLPHLDALAALGPLVKGVRRNLQDERDPDFCIRPDFVEGVRLLERYDFSFDICIRHEQLPSVTALVRACPAITFVLDHLGKPAIRERQLAPWRDHLEALAALPNVACKLSGLITESDWQHWQPEHLEPYVAHALAVFGPGRVLFGSDWPIVTLASTYQRWVETLDALTDQLTHDEQNQLRNENARRWYRLPPFVRKQ